MSQSSRPPGSPPAGGSGSQSGSRAARRSAAARRAQNRTVVEQQPFLQRYRTPLILLGVLAIAVVSIGFVFTRASEKAYACTNVWVPTSADTSPDRLGAAQPDMGNGHVGNGDFVRYTYCAPASGKHWNVPGGPITPRFYGADDTTYPQGWIHNLEHGGMVVLYSCEQGGCDPDEQARLAAFAQDFPDSPVCGLAGGVVGPVITRFEEMATPFAAVVWGRVLQQPALDIDEMKRFFAEEAERTNPELQCPRPSPSPEAPPLASPSAVAS